MMGIWEFSNRENIGLEGGYITTVFYPICESNTDNKILNKHKGFLDV